MTEEQVDWQRQVAEFASKSSEHSKAVDAARVQVFAGELPVKGHEEAVYTLAVQRFHMTGARAPGGAAG